MKYLLFFCLFAFGPEGVSPGKHAIYLSVVEVNHSSKQESAVVKVKVFTNDIEDAIYNFGNERISLTGDGGCGVFKTQIENYFSRYLKITVSGRALKLSLEGCEELPDAIWLEFKASCPSQWREVAVNAPFLTELFPTQSNVVSVNYDGKKQFANLTHSRSTHTFKF